MKYDWLESHCLSKTGAQKEFKPEWDALLYRVGGKMFAMQGGDKEGKAIITLKLEPLFGELLRKQYKDITAGYYMNKTHWNSVYLDGDVPDALLKEMIDKSYGLVAASLSKKAQSESGLG